MHLKGEEVIESDNEQSDDEMVEDEPKKEVKSKKAAPKKPQQEKKGKGDADSSSDEEESSDEEGAPVPQTAKERRAANQKLKQDLEQEQKEMAKVLMTNRQRKLYQKVQGEIDQKKEASKQLKIKRKKIEKKK